MSGLAALVVIVAWLAGCAAAPVLPPAGPAAPAPAASRTPRPPLVFTPPRPYADEPVPMLVGTVLGVTDGDTIKVQLSSGPIAVRMYSIDAPEKDQPWGSEARVALASRLNRRQVDLEVETQDRYRKLPYPLDTRS